VTSDVIKPWVQVLDHWGSSSQAASAIGVNLATLKIASANFLQMVVLTVAMRESVVIFYTARVEKDLNNTKKKLIDVKMALQKATKVAGAPLAVDVPQMAHAADKMVELVKLLAEGNEESSPSDENRIIGLSKLVGIGAQEYERELKAHLDEQLKELDLISGGGGAGQIWHHGLLDTAKFAGVHEHAKTTLLNCKTGKADEIDTRKIDVEKATCR
jgi:hypothetical protein